MEIFKRYIGIMSSRRRRDLPDVAAAVIPTKEGSPGIRYNNQTDASFVGMTFKIHQDEIKPFKRIPHHVGTCIF